VSCEPDWAQSKQFQTDNTLWDHMVGFHRGYDDVVGFRGGYNYSWGKAAALLPAKACHWHGVATYPFRHGDTRNRHHQQGMAISKSRASLTPEDTTLKG
jgi:hypothetical protein